MASSSQEWRVHLRNGEYISGMASSSQEWRVYLSEGMASSSQEWRVHLRNGNCRALKKGRLASIECDSPHEGIIKRYESQLGQAMSVDLVAFIDINTSAAEIKLSLDKE